MNTAAEGYEELKRFWRNDYGPLYEWLVDPYRKAIVHNNCLVVKL